MVLTWILAGTQIIGALVLPFVLLALRWAHCARQAEFRRLQNSLQALDLKGEQESQEIQAMLIRLENGLLVRIVALETRLDAHTTWHLGQVSYTPKSL